MPNRRSKLTVEQVREIRARVECNLESWTELGRIYGVHRETVRRVALRMNWRKVA